MAIDTVIHTNQHSIDRVLNAGAPVLLVFWRADVQPSAAMDPALSKLAQQYAGKALVAKIDAGEEQSLIDRFEVTQLPTLVFAKSGAPVATGKGAASEQELQAWLDFLIQGGNQPPLPSGPAVNIGGAAQTTTQAYTNGAADGSAGQPAGQESAAPITLTDVNFQQIVGGPGPVLVDFWAPWCGPCRMVAPAVEKLAREFQGKAVVGKLNVDENPQTAGRYQIMSIPALYIFKNGQVVDQLVGAQPEQVLRQRLAQQTG